MNLSPRSRWRWLAPVGAVVMVAAATTSTQLTGAFADSTPEPRTPSELIADIASAKVTGVSGTVTHTANLGLPDLSLLTGGSSGAAELSGIAMGTHTWRVWYAGPEQVRLALLGRGGESDVIRNGDSAWVWSSSAKTATQFTGLRRAGSGPTPDLSSPAAAVQLTPQQIATEILDRASTTSTITSAGTQTVAGRTTYELQVTPKSTDTLVKSISIDVDAVKRVPLRVRVYSTKLAAPAFEVGFTSVNFATPAADQFSFNPPPGTTVTRRALGAEDHSDAGAGSPAPVAPGRALPESSATSGSEATPESDSESSTRVSGTGWSTVRVINSSALAGVLNETDGDSSTGADQQGNPLPAMIGLLQQLPVESGAWGTGHVFEGTLFSAVITDSGRVAVGAVPATTLYAALGAQ